MRLSPEGFKDAVAHVRGEGLSEFRQLSAILITHDLNQE